LKDRTQKLFNKNHVENLTIETSQLVTNYYFFLLDK